MQLQLRRQLQALKACMHAWTAISMHLCRQQCRACLRAALLSHWLRGLHMQGLRRMVELLAVAPLRAAILEGLVASIGGLDGSLSKAATAQLVHWLNAGVPALPI